jgi:hypothetical protein
MSDSRDLDIELLMRAANPVREEDVPIPSQLSTYTRKLPAPPTQAECSSDGAGSCPY